MHAVSVSESLKNRPVNTLTIVSPASGTVSVDSGRIRKMADSGIRPVVTTVYESKALD